jgi:hypothetical protein
MKVLVDVKMIDAPMHQPKDHINQVFKNKDGVLSFLSELEDIVKSNSYFDAKPQHVYFTVPYSVFILMEGAGFSFIHPNNSSISEYCDETKRWVSKSEIEASSFIVASTDPSLKQPNIPESFLKNFVNAKGDIKFTYLEQEYVGFPYSRNIIKKDESYSCIISFDEKDSESRIDMSISREDVKKIIRYLERLGQLEDFENYPTDLEKAKAFIREDFSAMLDFYTRN